MSRTAGSTGVETRERILAAARALFAERGYAGTSIRDLAEALGFTKAALYYHFPGKAEILHALVEPLLEELDAISDRADREPDAAMRDYVRLLAARAPGVIGLISDPSAKADVGERFDAQRRFRSLERKLASDGGVLGVRCALGAAHFAVFSTLSARARAGEPPELSDDEIERIIRAALAAWDAAA